MIKKVIIKNFQSHKNTELEFLPGTNVIIGQSDTGKSAVFRAINWVVTNRPLGDAFRSEWGGNTRVALHTEEGNTVERIRTASKNEYVLNGETLTAFGTEVPDEINQVLCLDEYSVQAQMDSPFLLAMTPGEAAQVLNKAASIDDIDHAVSSLKSTHRELNRDLEYNQEQLEEHQEEMERYDNIPDIDEKLQQAEQLQKEVEKKEQALTQLQRLTATAKDLTRKLQETEHIPAVLEQYQQADTLLRLFLKKQEDHDRKQTIVDRVQKVQEALRTTEYVDDALQYSSATQKYYELFKSKQEKQKKLAQLVKKAQKLAQAVDRAESRIQKLEDEFHATAPELCPLCGNEWEGERGEAN